MAKKKKMTNFFINAFYESKFRDKLFVVKAGGKVIEDQEALDCLIKDIKELTYHGIKILLVFGGGRAMDEAAKERGIEVKKHAGRRVTDQASIDLMKEVVGGTLSLSVNQSMAKAGLEGYCFNAVPHDWMSIETRAKKPIDYGFVADINSTSKRAITRLFKTSDFVACACLATDDEGVLHNINADTIATELAIGADADKLIFLSDVDGVQIDGKAAFVITTEEIPALIEEDIVTGGMKVKMENCAQALEGGVQRIHLLNGLRKNALYNEIFEPIGPGTMLLKESERAHYMNEIEAQKVIGARK